MNYHNKFDERLKERFFNTQRFSSHDINKFILLLQKGFYSHKYISDSEKFYETSLPENKCFYNYLNMEDNTYSNYDLHVQSDTFLCLEAYKLDPTCFFTAPDLAQEVAL